MYLRSVIILWEFSKYYLILYNLSYIYTISKAIYNLIFYKKQQKIKYINSNEIENNWIKIDIDNL